MSADPSAANGPREIETDQPASGQASRIPSPLWKGNHIFAASALLVGLIIVAGLAAVLWESARPNAGKPAPAAAGQADATKVPVTKSAEGALATARLLSLRTLSAEARATEGKYKAAIAKWDHKVADVLEGDSGRKLAANDQLLDRFAVLLEKERLSEEQQTSLAQQLDTLSKPLEEAFRIGDASFSPPTAYWDEMERVRDRFRKAAESLQRDDELLAIILQDTATEDPGVNTARERLQERRKARTRAQLVAIGEATKAAEEEALKVLAEAEASAIKKRAAAEAKAKQLIGESEAKRLLDEAELRKKTLDDEFARKKLAEEQLFLRRRAEDPAVQRRFSGLLDKGFRRFNSHPKAAYLDKSIEAEPASWSELNSNGWLADANSFARAICPQPLAGYSDVPNDRRTRSYPTSDAEWKQAEVMLQEFKQLGPVWVEMKLLLP